MKSHYVTNVKKKDRISGPISRQLRICVACGNSQVQEYEFGLSCELCGTSFYFGKVNNLEVN